MNHAQLDAVREMERELKQALARCGALEAALRAAEQSLTEMMEDLAVFHGEAGWALFREGAPEWKRAMETLQVLRGHLAGEEEGVELMSQILKERAESAALRARCEALTDALERAVACIGSAVPKEHSPFCNGVHAENGACEGDYQVERLLEDLRALLAAPAPEK